MTKVTIDRELLEQVASEFEHDNDRHMLGRELRKILDAPRQPEGDGLEVRATEEYHLTKGGVEYYDLCRLSDAQRAIAELREECERLREERDSFQRVGISAAEQATKGTEMLAAAYTERDNLRQQLAERDAEIERLRVQLLAIFSAEPGRHNIEWAKAMAATGNNEAHAKWRAAFDQRDKLAGLLREKFPRIDPEKPYPLDEVEHHCEYTLYKERERLHREINAALAEVKP